MLQGMKFQVGITPLEEIDTYVWKPRVTSGGITIPLPIMPEGWMAGRQIYDKVTKNGEFWLSVIANEDGDGLLVHDFDLFMECLDDATDGLTVEVVQNPLESPMLQAMKQILAIIAEEDEV